MTYDPPSGSPLPQGELLVGVLQDRPVRPFDIPATGTSQKLFTRPCLLMGWSLRETTGSAAAAVVLFNGAGAGGPRVGEQQLASGASASQVGPADGIWCDTGLYLFFVSGSVEGSVWLKF